MTFDQRLLQLVNAGTITEEAALEKANNPEGLTMNLKGIFLGTDNGILS
jgi:Tfp pilus assembly ATPase PilU